MVSVWSSRVSSRSRAVKDPRTSWALNLWSQVAEDLGISLGFLVMLRHPAEVISSRATHYAAGIETMGEAGFAVKNLAGWVNAMLLSEQQTRGRRRSFVRYDALLADWRTSISTAASDLGVKLDTDAGSLSRHPVDDFIDPDLSRHRLSWSDVDVLPELADVAGLVWQACERLADHHGADTVAASYLDAARSRYAKMYLAAQQLSHDSTAARVNRARDAGRSGPGQPSDAVGGREALRALLRAVRGRLGRLRR